MSGVYIRWYNPGTVFQLDNSAWANVSEGVGYAIYGLGGDGSFVRTDGHLPLPFPQDE
jgi:hypothetical protein